MAARLQDFNVFTAKSLQNREMSKKKKTKQNRLLKALGAKRLLALKNSCQSCCRKTPKNYKKCQIGEKSPNVIKTTTYGIKTPKIAEKNAKQAGNCHFLALLNATK